MEETRNVRWALSMAIDREAIVESVLGGFGYANYLEFVDSQKANNPYWDDKWTVLYDLAKAKELAKLHRWHRHTLAGSLAMELACCDSAYVTMYSAVPRTEAPVDRRWR